MCFFKYIGKMINAKLEQLGYVCLFRCKAIACNVPFFNCSGVVCNPGFVLINRPAHIWKMKKRREENMACVI